MTDHKYVCHKDHDVNYGQYFVVNGTAYYERWRNVKVNQAKSAPKVCLEQQTDVKEAPADFWEHFKEISFPEWCVIDTIHYTKAQ